MTCKNCTIKPVWKFTNQTQLCKNCFIDYLERKVFRTIRKYQMLPENREITLKKDNSLNSAVLKSILEKKFQVKFSTKPNFSSENLSQVSEDAFSNIIKGNFAGKKPKDNISRPLYFISDSEIELYAKFKSIKEKAREKNKKIHELFERFSKNPDLEHNIVNALLQL